MLVFASPAGGISWFAGGLPVVIRVFSCKVVERITSLLKVSYYFLIMYLAFLQTPDHCLLIIFFPALFKGRNLRERDKIVARGIKIICESLSSFFTLSSC